MKLSWSRRSLRELAGIEAYISEQNPSAARRVAAAIVESAYRLEDFPHIGRRSERSDIRLLKVTGLPYIMPYRVEDKVVEILAVLHERIERPGDWT